MQWKTFLKEQPRGPWCLWESAPVPSSPRCSRHVLHSRSANARKGQTGGLQASGRLVLWSTCFFCCGPSLPLLTSQAFPSSPAVLLVQLHGTKAGAPCAPADASSAAAAGGCPACCCSAPLACMLQLQALARSVQPPFAFPLAGTCWRSVLPRTKSAGVGRIAMVAGNSPPKQTLPTYARSLPVSPRCAVNPAGGGVVRRGPQQQRRAHLQALC